ncbi:MAG: C25 family cysteine peptidase [candidate division KSB1 bacterium]|nr:C25 family cysteine peptidase [candidate division KSB1 bacterium]MDZ7335514.1 C25 family cysteine peptidase [candidate division KSB1 bacterium]MDZ7357105.1 C25 family cysteine peptidase [candidate division KSB1 bacterium]MDZ7376610.1 C25 family cysteine peptidase [candidate division KSB1 bacterium]MDZ7401771.1 C25 family cysteine peptidase [candidate division KSB1 bacterium]
MGKKNRVIFVVLVSLIAQKIGLCEIITHSYRFSAPEMVQQPDGTYLAYVPKCYQAGKIGEPTLPLYPICLLLPPGHSAKDLKISFRGKREVNHKYFLSPKQAPQTSDAGSKKPVINESIYESAKSYTGFPPSVQTHYYFGHSVALACFCPLEYVPRERTLFYYSEAWVEITTELDDRAVQAQQLYRSSAETLAQLARIVDNFNASIQNYPKLSSNKSYDYLIVTIKDFLDDYESLVHFYAELGIKTKIMPVEEIYQLASGADEPEKIRNYIIHEVQENGIRFVLLAGDGDTSPLGQMQVPFRGLYCKVLSGNDVYEDKSIPSDLYYAALDGNWNQNGDDLWGEPGEDDLLPELAVGRICADNEAEIRAIINKICNYQARPVVQDATKILMVGEKLWNDPLSYGSDYLNLLIGDRTDNGYATVGMPSYLNFTFLYEEDQGILQKDVLIQQINQGYNMIYHAGHSSSGTNMTLSRFDVTPNNFAQINGIDHLNPVIYSHGCLAAAFDMTNYSGEDCIAEKMMGIENFASAYIGNSRYGWFNEGQTEGPSLHLNREFVSALYGDSVAAIGAAHTLSRIRSAPFVTAPNQWEPGALRWCFYCCNVLGDPAMTLWTDQIREFDQVKYPERIFNTPAEITINTGVAKARVAISGQNGLLACAVADQNGKAQLQIDAVQDSKLIVTITALNHRMFAGHILVQSTDVISSDPANPTRFELKPVFPNPFNGTIEIHVSIQQTGPVSLEIYNLIGQKIVTLWDRELPQGWHRFIWEGLDQNGLPVASGCYMVTLRSDEGVRMRSITLLK